MFRDFDEALMAYDAKAISLHAKIKVRRTLELGEETISKLVETTVGRIIFNQPIPQDLGFVDRSDPEHLFDLEIDFLVGKSSWARSSTAVSRCTAPRKPLRFWITSRPRAINIPPRAASL